MSSQTALVIPTPKAPFTLSTTEMIPSPGPGEVLLKICSTALNPGNWKQREYDVVIEEYPAILGMDIAGVIEAVGPGVAGFKKGYRVFTQTVLGGGFQQYTTVPAAVLMPIPDNVSFDEAATIPTAFVSAAVGLLAPAPIGLGLNPTFSWDQPLKGQSALVLGGSTSVGQFAIQLLKFMGATRIVVYASATHFDYLRRIGATECIDRRQVPIDSLAAHPSLSVPVNVVFDAAGAQYDSVGGAKNVAYDCVEDGGSITTLVWTPEVDRDRKKKVNIVSAMGYLAGPDVVRLKRDNVNGYSGTVQHTAFGKLIIQSVPEMLRTGALVGNRVEVLPGGLAGIVGGLERLKDGTVSGVKLVAHPWDPIA
ncbi:GroES-like protein [Favolaschia claudopus]|uniref:GroES-like protein n=1 Tax=Favolaschia claudopus TaxID=2862362 RepID=A0AAW0EAJ4_9AGAR